MTTHSETVEKIRKLMDLAKDQEGMPEGELAASIARQMMQKHCIEESEIILSEGFSGIAEEMHELESMQDWRRFLLSIVCDHLECKMVFFDKTRYVKIFGYKQDIERAIYVYSLCSKHIEKEAKLYYKNELRGEVRVGFLTKGEALGMRKNFCFSACFAIRDKLAKQRKDEQKESSGGVFALVLRKREKVEDYYQEEVGEISEKKISREFSEQGYFCGMQIELAPGLE